jgi:hypothetical protein
MKSYLLIMALEKTWQKYARRGTHEGDMLADLIQHIIEDIEAVIEDETDKKG